VNRAEFREAIAEQSLCTADCQVCWRGLLIGYCSLEAIGTGGATPTPIAQFTYNKASQETQVLYKSNAKTTWDYVSYYGFLNKITHKNPSQETIASFDYDYDKDEDQVLEESDSWRPMNVSVHGPGAIGQIMQAKWYNYSTLQDGPGEHCDSGYYYYFYDAVGNVIGVMEESNSKFYRFGMDAFGNDIPGGNTFLAMDQPGPKEHLTGKMFDTVTGLYYHHARWYEPESGRFITQMGHTSTGCTRKRSLDPEKYFFVRNSPLQYLDPTGNAPIIEKSCDPYRADVEKAVDLTWSDLDACCFLDLDISQKVHRGIEKAFNHARIECVYDPSSKYCGRANSWNGKITLYFPDVANDQVCGCIESTLFHEVVHLVGRPFGKGEKTAYACEVLCVPCSRGKIPPEYQGGTCSW